MKEVDREDGGGNGEECPSSFLRHHLSSSINVGMDHGIIAGIIKILPAVALSIEGLRGCERRGGGGVDGRVWE